MRQTVLEYNRDNFPIAGILGDLTNTVENAQMQPLEALLIFENELAAHGLGRRILDYGRTAITSGGHARVPELQKTIDVDGHIVDKPQMNKIIKANTHTAREIVRLLQASGAVQANEMLLSVDLGNTGWDQVQFMDFWLLCNAGPDLQEIANRPHGLSIFEQTIKRTIHEAGVDLAVMGSSGLDREVRRLEYRKHARAYAALMERENAGWRPVRRQLELVDTSLSLGSDAEGIFADSVRTPNPIPKLQVVAVRPATIDEAVPSPLREDLHIIQAHGGTVCVAAAGSTLALQPAPALTYAAV